MWFVYVIVVFVLWQERLAQQKAEKAAKGDDYSSSFKPQRSKDEAKERRKAILSNIGEVRTVHNRTAAFPAC